MPAAIPFRKVSESTVGAGAAIGLGLSGASDDAAQAAEISGGNPLWGGAAIAILQSPWATVIGLNEITEELNLTNDPSLYSLRAHTRAASLWNAGWRNGANCDRADSSQDLESRRQTMNSSWINRRILISPNELLEFH